MCRCVSGCNLRDWEGGGARLKSRADPSVSFLWEIMQVYICVAYTLYIVDIIYSIYYVNNIIYHYRGNYSFNLRSKALT